MAKAPATDPRVVAPTEEVAAEADVRPVVRVPRAGLPGWAIGAGAVVAGILLFTVLDARRRGLETPPEKSRFAEASLPAPPPPLFVPPGAPPLPVYAQPAPVPAPAPAPPAPPRIVYVPQPVPVPTPVPTAEAPPAPTRVASGPVLVFDSGGTPAAAAAGGAAQAAPDTGEVAVPGGVATLGVRTRAGMLANRTTTVAQGALIPAVLETALDSTRAGFARAVVSRDVRGFDGSRVLIPRGSRLIGEYRAEVAPGQRRALVIWIRLIRPDGVTIAIGSPAGDPLGRGGIRANVNTHFFERFAGAILQSGLDIGVNLASTAAGGAGTVLVLPGQLTGSVGQIVQPAQITPTLTVRQGTSISIFVARDLDFTGVEGRR